MKALNKAFQRLRHRRGYGVHSPFIYSLLKDLSAPPGSYYNDLILTEELSGHNRHLRRKAFLIHRLIARLKPEYLYIEDNQWKDIFRQTATLADSRIKILSALPEKGMKPSMIVYTGKHAESRIEEMIDFLKSEGQILVLCGEKNDIENAVDGIRNRLSHGWAVIDRQIAIFISSSLTPFIDYEVKLI